MSNSPVRSVLELGFPWPTLDPFLFCVHHDDRYPRGNDDLGPAASLAGRNLGMDFEVRDGWRMYHGRTIPGFPQHPHRGFETVTLARRGFIDHSDSLGARARFGEGDVQWLTAGAGIQHSEMFPLLKRDAENPVELFQIWLNLPAKDKMAAPHFSMLWAESIPRIEHRDGERRGTEVVVVAGQGFGVPCPPAPPKSWATDPSADLSIATIRMEPHATWILPAARALPHNRVLYFFQGEQVDVSGHVQGEHAGLVLHADRPVLLRNGATPAELLLLSGRPIGEPVAQHGPFVMNTRAEIQRAFYDYQRTAFGGWPWRDEGPAHGREDGRFAERSGVMERPPRA